METLAKILGASEETLKELEHTMGAKNFAPAAEKIAGENEEFVARALQKLGVTRNAQTEDVFAALTAKAGEGEDELYKYLGVSSENLDFHKVAEGARTIATESTGFFLKKEYGARILQERPPQATLDFLGYKIVDELLQNEDITEIFSALRFLESNEWMHETFDVAYTKFTPEDFEERPIEIKVLGKQWEEVAKKYVAKKHHNVSHLKEFGVIFLNPIAQTERGKFIRDFALLLHYFHEIAFYSRLFKKYAVGADFQQRFIALLRGDVKEATAVHEGEWLIVQRYLWKENPNDARLFVPHVNPESMHWRKAEQDLVAFGKQHDTIDLEFWDQFWSVAEFFPARAGGETLVSFDLEDIAMTLVSRSAGVREHFVYHQREALWNRLFAAYVGGYEHIEKHIVDSMDTGIISL